MNLCDGVGIPTILISDEELCDNRFFDENIDGWESDNADLTYREYESHLGSYVLEIQDSDIVNAGYAYYQTLASPGSNLILLFSAWIKGISSEAFRGRLAFYDYTTLLGWKYFDYSTEWEIYSILINGADITDGRLIIRVYPAHAASETAKIYLIAPKIRIIDEIICLDHPTNRATALNMVQWWSTDKDDVNRFDNQKQGARLADSLNFEHIERTSEQRKLQAMESRRVIFYPHLDADSCYSVRFDADQPVIYFRDKYLGHAAQFSLIDMELRDGVSLKEGW